MAVAAKELCSKEGCQRRVATVYYVRWTVRHQHYNVWLSCVAHRTLIQHNLLNGVWSGGVKPIDFKTHHH